MATNILMPALSPTMTEGTLSRWLKKEGEAIRSGDVIAEIETDKATMEVEANDDGVLGKILVPDGTQGVKVNEPIAQLRQEGATGEDENEPDDAPPKVMPDEAKPAAGQAADRAPQPTRQDQPSQAPVPPAPGRSKENGPDAERLAVSPLARRMARQAGIDLSGLKGSGPGGRIVKGDIEAASRPGAEAGKAPPSPQPPPSQAAAQAAPALAGPHSLVPNSGMRRTIARRLAEAKRSIPHFYISMDVELDAALKLRAELNARSTGDGPGAFKLSVNDMLIKAAAVALRRVPGVNAAWTDEAIARFEDVDISVAVSIPDGLITPIIRRADQKGLAAISREMKDMAERARAGKLKPEEFQGGGFSISNMGMYGVSEFAAIINPPQAAILAIAAGLQRPVVRDGALGIATVATCTLSLDHRAVDGALGAEWLAAFRSIVEDPLSLML